MTFDIRDKCGNVTRIRFDETPRTRGGDRPNSGIAEVFRENMFVGHAKWRRRSDGYGRDDGYEVADIDLEVR